MASIAKAIAMTVLVLAALVASAAAAPATPTTVLQTVDWASPATRIHTSASVTTEPAFWLGARASHPPGSSTTVTYCETTSHSLEGPFQEDQTTNFHCISFTESVSFETRTVTEYQDLPTNSEGRCDTAWGVLNETTVMGPLAEDCIELARRIRGPGQWTVSGIGSIWHQLVEYRTCSFWVSGDGWAPVFLVGNQDIIDILRDAVRDFTSVSGRVGSSGNMFCMNTVGVGIQVQYMIMLNPEYCKYC